MANFEVKLDEEAIKAQVASAINEALVDLAAKFRGVAFDLDPEGEASRGAYMYNWGYDDATAGKPRADIAG